MTLSPAMREFLQDERFAVLATSMPDGSIQQTVMWYELRDDDTIVMNTAPGRVKDHNVRRDPRVSVCWEQDYTYLTARGRVTDIVEDQDTAQDDAMELARRYNPDSDNIEEEFSHFRKQERETLVIQIEEVVANNL